MKSKPLAVVSYITFIGLIIAYVLNRDKKDPFVTWHIKNMFGLVLLLFISMVTQDHVNPTLGFIIYIIASVSWLISIIMAILNKQKAVPFLSDQAQKWFQFLD